MKDTKEFYEGVNMKTDKNIIDDDKVIIPNLKFNSTTITKELVLEELFKIVEQFNEGAKSVKCNNKIDALKQICLMKGFNEPLVQKIVTEIEIDF